MANKRKAKTRTDAGAVDLVRNFVASCSAGVFVGIDPGVYGGIAFLSEQGHAAVVIDMPNVKVPPGRKVKGSPSHEFDYQQIADIFCGLVMAGTSRQVNVILERTLPNAGYKVSASSRYRMGHAYGMWPLFLTSLSPSLDWCEVPPANWKKDMGLTKDKEGSLKLARKLFPQAELHLKKHNDRAEALLLAEHLRRAHAKGGKK